MSPSAAPDALRGFHPHVRGWFRTALGPPTPPQALGWPVIASGADTLIVAPTGSGKTLAAFLWFVDRLVRRAAEAPLANAVHVLYVSPLKALANDVRRNLEDPLAAISDRFARDGRRPDVRLAVRSGDTPARERRRMLRAAPHLLVTTPESLHILLTTPRQQGLFSALDAVIVDEVHALAGSKRGAHLALTLERLAAQAGRRIQRVGLSATVAPPEEAAHWLAGAAPDGAPRPARVVAAPMRRPAELVVRSPVADLAHVEGTVWPDVCRMVLHAVRAGRTTLVFVNARGVAERLAAQVNALAHETVVHPYHGSLDRERRLALEAGLKAGALRGLVTTSALELGIDIGSVDQVVQVQSPTRVGSALQRLGRAGHRLDEVSRALFIPTHLTDALEMLAIVEAAREGAVEPTAPPRHPLDVLAQVLVAAVALEARTADALFALVRGAWNYRDLPRAAFDGVLEMLAGRYPAEVAAELAPRVNWDRTSGVVSPLPGSRLAAVLNGGTIPDRGTYKAVLADGGVLGELDEEFVFESRVGDAFRLGASTFRIVGIEHARVLVQPAPGAAARIPFWHGEGGGRDVRLAERVGAIARAVEDARTDADRDALATRLGADRALVDALAEWLTRQRAATGVVPDERTLVVERHRDETGALRLVLHAPFGLRTTAPWALALAGRLSERLGADVVPMALNEGLMLRLPDLADAPPESLLEDLSGDEAERRVLAAIGRSALFGARFRMNAARALVLPRSTPGRRLPLWMQRLKAQDLLAAVRGEPGFPVLVETYRDVLQDAFDLPALRAVLADLATGRRRLLARAVPTPSPFSQAYAFRFVADWMYGDDAPRGAAGGGDVLSLDLALLGDLLGHPGDDRGVGAAVAAVLALRRGTAAGRQARTADELAVLVARAGDVTREELEARLAPAAQRRGDPVAELLRAGRLVTLDVPRAGPRLILRDDLPRWVAAFGDGIAPEGRGVAPVQPRGQALAECIVRWLSLAGPVGVDDVCVRYAAPAAFVEALLRKRAAAGALVQVADPADRARPRWASRRVLEAAWRRAMPRSRTDVAPVDLARFQAMLLGWHGIGTDGDASRHLRQLAGAPVPAEALLADVLPARLAAPRAPLADAISGGRVVWIGAPRGPSPPLALEQVRLVPRGDRALWNAEPAAASVTAHPLTADEALVAARLGTRGALFAADLLAETGLAADRLTAALAGLAARGVVTSDAVDGLAAAAAWRAQARPSARGPRRWQRPDRLGAGWSGRWSLVAGGAADARPMHERAEAVARVLLDRYGVVSREAWRRDRPAVGWREVSRALMRLAFRGEAVRGWFVRGLSPAQFAHPAAVDALHAVPGAEVAPVVLAAADPANAARLVADPASLEAHVRPGGRGAAVVIGAGAGDVLAGVEGGGRRVRLATGLEDGVLRDVGAAIGRWAASRQGTARPRDVVLERLDDGEPAAHPALAAFVGAGWRQAGRTLRWPAPVGSATLGVTRSPPPAPPDRA